MRRRWLWILAAGIAAGIALSGLYKHFVTDRNAAPALPDIPADAALLALDWTQNGGESMEGSFVFILTAENGAYTLSDGEDSIPLTDSQWRQVEQTLRAGAHTAPVELPEGVEVLDAVESTLAGTWRTAGGETVSAVYDGQHESALRDLLAGFLPASVR